MAVCAGDEGERQRLQIHCAPLCDTAHRVRIRKSWANAPIAPQEKILYVPQPDYSSQLMITELMLAKYCGAYLPSVPKPLVQTLAHIGKYYTPKFIEKAVRMTCTPRRLQRLARKPLSVDEFVPALASFDPVYRENFDENTRIENFKVRLPTTTAPTHSRPNHSRNATAGRSGLVMRKRYAFRPRKRVRAIQLYIFSIVIGLLTWCCVVPTGEPAADAPKKK